MYHCVCHTCIEDEVYEELSGAQEYFNEHAERRCEVEIFNVDLAAEQLAGPAGDVRSTKDARPVDE